MMRKVRPAFLAGMTLVLYGCGGSDGRNASPPVEERDYLPFTATDTDNYLNAELWRTDGTESGTRVVHEIAESGGSRPVSITQSGRRTFFVASDGVHGPEVWVTDGAGKNTILLGDIHPGPDVVSPLSLTLMGEQLFFTHDDGVHGRELWVSDGTPAGTRLVKDIAPGVCEGAPGALTVVGDTLLFWVRDSCETWPSLWRSDGTEQGTYRLEGLDFDRQNVFMTQVWQGHVYWVTSTSREYSLWQSDGTAEGTRLLLGGEMAGIRYINNLSGGYNHLFFTARTDAQGEELWWYDPVTDALQTLDILEGQQDSLPEQFVTLGEITYFLAHSVAGSQPEVWRTDGTQAGTWRVLPRKIWRTLAVYGDHLVAIAAGNGELWLSDGTEQGSRRVAAEAGFGVPTLLGVVYGQLIFDAPHQEYGREIWRTDGTDEGTVLIKDICPGPCDGPM